MKWLIKKILLFTALVGIVSFFYLWRSYSNNLSEKPSHLKEIELQFTQNKDQKKEETSKQRLRDYYTSGKYEKEVQAVCNNAKDYFSKQIINPNSVIIFDVDDTALYNWHPAGDFIWSQPPFSQNWQQKIKPAIKPVLELFNQLRAQGYKIIFLTSRSDNDYENTKHELKSAGYTNFEKLILMPTKLAFDRNIKTADWKLSVRKELAQTYDIVGCVGDRVADFEGGYAGYEVKIPNYVY